MAAVRPPPNKNRLPLYLGVGVASVVGYYLYNAGGSSKIAKTEAESKPLASLTAALLYRMLGLVFQTEANVCPYFWF
jgi:hypothetical protein